MIHRAISAAAACLCFDNVPIVCWWCCSCVCILSLWIVCYYGCCTASCVGCVSCSATSTTTLLCCCRYACCVCLCKHGCSRNSSSYMTYLCVRLCVFYFLVAYRYVSAVWHWCTVNTVLCTINTTNLQCYYCSELYCASSTTKLIAICKSSETPSNLHEICHERIRTP